MNCKKQLLLSFCISLICINLYAYVDPVTDISDYPDNYHDLSLSDFSYEDVELKQSSDLKSYKMTLPIRVSYSPNFPYEFILLNEDSNIGTIGNMAESYQTASMNIDTVHQTEIFTLKVEGNELSKHKYYMYIDYQKTFYAKNNLLLDSTIPITLEKDFEYNSTNKVTLWDFGESSISYDGFPYYRNSYFIKLKKGYRNENLLKFHFSWPENASNMLPSGFENTYQLVAYVAISITDEY